MRSFQGNGVQGNRGGLGKQPLSLAKKRIPAIAGEIATGFSIPRNDKTTASAVTNLKKNNNAKNIIFS